MSESAVAERPMSRMQQRYLSEVRGKLQAEFGYKNSMQVPSRRLPPEGRIGGCLFAVMNYASAETNLARIQHRHA